MKKCKYFLMLLVLVGLALPAWSQDSGAGNPDGEANENGTVKSNFLEHVETLDSETNQVSYAIGVNIARNLQHNYPNVNITFFILALRDVFGGERLKLNEDQIHASIAKYSEEANRVARARVNRTADVNLQKAERFLEVNGAKEDVTTTASGLQYRVIHTGSGPKPKEGTEVRFNCTTKLMGGHVIDSTVIEGKSPLVVRLDNTIPAWEEAISMMNVGSKWEIYAHPKLAYGEAGANNVGPNELLIFSIELVGTQQ